MCTPGLKSTGGAGFFADKFILQFFWRQGEIGSVKSASVVFRTLDEGTYIAITRKKGWKETSVGGKVAILSLANIHGQRRRKREG